MDISTTKWTGAAYADFREYLKSMGEENYKEFNSKIIPDTSRAYGIRVPALRKIAKDILRGDYKAFLSLEKTDYHEEVIIEGLVMAGAKTTYPEMLSYMKAFGEKIYNWAICDTVSFKGVKKYRKEFFGDIEYFIYNKNPWLVRMGFGHLMAFYLDGEYIHRVLDYVNSVNSDFYYVEMMQGWLVATAAAKQRDVTMEFLAKNNLNDDTQNMAIRKMRESLRISKEDKDAALKFKRPKPKNIL